MQIQTSSSIPTIPFAKSGSFSHLIKASCKSVRKNNTPRQPERRNPVTDSVRETSATFPHSTPLRGRTNKAPPCSVPSRQVYRSSGTGGPWLARRGHLHIGSVAGYHEFSSRPYVFTTSRVYTLGVALRLTLSFRMCLFQCGRRTVVPPAHARLYIASCPRQVCAARGRYESFF